MAHLIFHLNILADPAMIRFHAQYGIAELLAETYGNRPAWYRAYGQILADWDSYHADLNFSGEEGMGDMREARFRVMRALFRIVGIAEPSQEEIHALADKALTIRWGDVFGHYGVRVLALAEQYEISLVSYFPQIQLEAIAGSRRENQISHCFGADTFEQYEMNRHYFEMLLLSLKAKPEDCLYIDKQTQVLEAASQLGIKTFLVESHEDTFHWYLRFYDFLAKETP